MSIVSVHSYEDGHFPYIGAHTEYLTLINNIDGHLTINIDRAKYNQIRTRENNRKQGQRTLIGDKDRGHDRRQGQKTMIEDRGQR